MPLIVAFKVDRAHCVYTKSLILSSPPLELLHGAINLPLPPGYIYNPYFLAFLEACLLEIFQEKEALMRTPGCIPGSLLSNISRKLNGWEVSYRTSDPGNCFPIGDMYVFILVGKSSGRGPVLEQQ